MLSVDDSDDSTDNPISDCDSNAESFELVVVYAEEYPAEEESLSYHNVDPLLDRSSEESSSRSANDPNDLFDEIRDRSLRPLLTLRTVRSLNNLDLIKALMRTIES